MSSRIEKFIILSIIHDKRLYFKFSQIMFINNYNKIIVNIVIYCLNKCSDRCAGCCDRFHFNYLNNVARAFRSARGDDENKR